MGLRLSIDNVLARNFGHKGRARFPGVKNPGNAHAPVPKRRGSATMTFIDPIDQGWIKRIDPSQPLGRAGGARCVVTQPGCLLCSFVTQSRLGSNDFVPAIARSGDGGVTWHDENIIWPDLAERWSILASISRSPDGTLLLFGSRTPIDEPGEPFWSDQVQGLKANELIWAGSDDDGQTWSDPQPISLPVAGAAEAPGPMCVTRDGRWLCCYCPYPTFDPAVRVDRSRVILLVSDDRGQTWRHTQMLRLTAPDSGGADARIVELADGRLLATAWHLNLNDHADHPIACAISNDPLNWPATAGIDIMGQSQSTAPLPDGRALIAYTNRKHPQPGIQAALLRFDDDHCLTVHTDIAWHVDNASHQPAAQDHSHWTDFAFGGPSIVVIEENVALLTCWVHQHDGRGVRYVRFRFQS